jgi:hypothetical protein
MNAEEFANAIAAALAAEPQALTPSTERPDLRPLFYKLGCIADVIAWSGFVGLGQREALRTATERCFKLVREPQVRPNRETLILCSEVIGYLSTVESCSLPVDFPEALEAFAHELRIGVVGLASRAAFALSTTGSHRRLVAALAK